MPAQTMQLATLEVLEWVNGPPLLADGLREAQVALGVLGGYIGKPPSIIRVAAVM